jgi:hypothetical protein
VFQALLPVARHRDPARKANIRVNFPINGTEFGGQARNRSGRDIRDTYVVTTQAEVTVEASLQGMQTSLAKNNLTLTWDVLIKLDRSGAIDARGSRATLNSIAVAPTTGFFESDRQQMQSFAETLINNYYQTIQDGRFASIEIPDEWRNTLQNSTRRERDGNISVSLPSSTSFDVRTVPDLKIFVDQEAFYRIDMGFSIVINEDLSSGRITRVDFRELESPIVAVQEEELEPEPVMPVAVATPDPVAQPIVTQPSVVQPAFARPNEIGRSYKVQILSLLRHVPISDLPQQFRIDDITIERYIIDGVSYFKYVVPAGTTLSEAASVRNLLVGSGIEGAWIAIYRDGARVSPNQGMPEIVR